ncbi:hypothetical protein K438DRAFT_1998517 [Mycena galopus ATCC 62051]|nr:hypothetical protein K438DRAFT_1998517 [Mycena galopus ATCC 62051]
MLGFTALRALWGDGPLPPPPPHSYFCVPDWPPWVGPVVDADRAARAHANELMKAGKPLPAHEYSEHTCPLASCWWPDSIAQLHDEADSESRSLKYAFQKRHPPRYRVLDAAFLRDRELLTARLAQDAAKAAAILPEMLSAVSILTNDFLTAWICCPDPEVALWGTAIDPRSPPPTLDVSDADADGSACSGVGWGSATEWGNGAAWGDNGAWGSSDRWPWALPPTPPPTP